MNEEIKKKINEQIASLELAINNNKPGVREDGVFLSRQDVKEIELRHHGSLEALRWMLEIMDNNQCPAS